MKTKSFLIVLLVTGISLNISAQNRAEDKKKENTNEQQSLLLSGRGVWIDTDKNGVCDKIQWNRAPGRGFGPANASASRRGNGRLRGGRAYIAEQFAKAGNRLGLPAGQGRGCGRGFGPGRGAGMAQGGRFYSDENKNGICDYYERTLKRE